MSRKILKAIPAVMESRCSCCSVGVMGSLGLRSAIRLAAVCRTDVRGCRVSMKGDWRGKSCSSRVSLEMMIESLNKNTEANFVRATFHLSNSAKVENACSGNGRYRPYVEFYVQSAV